MAGTFGPSLRAWYREDPINRAVAQSASKVLRELAYATRSEARKLLIRREFLRDNGRTSRKYRKLRNSYSWVRKDGRMVEVKRRRRYRPSDPGESPTNQTGVLKASILYDFRASRDAIMETFIGPIALKRGAGSALSHWSFTNGRATAALEHGGMTINHGGKMVHIEARPFMQPAMQAVIDSNTVANSLHGAALRSLPGFSSWSGEGTLIRSVPGWSAWTAL